MKKVYLYLSLEDESEQVKHILEVKRVKVDIGQSVDNSDNKGLEKQPDEKIRRELEDKVIKLLNVPKENIVISLMED